MRVLFKGRAAVVTEPTDDGDETRSTDEPSFPWYDQFRGRVERALVEAGYPDTAIAWDWAVGDRFRADMAIMDKATKRPVALIELRKRQNQASLDSAARQLHAFADALEGENVSLFVLFEEGTGSRRIQFNRLPADIRNPRLGDLVRIAGVPDYATLLNQVRAATVATRQIQRQQTVDDVTKVCWALGAMLLALLLLDIFWPPLELTTARLALVGAIVGLFIVPFASKLKVLGFEFERAVSGGDTPTPGVPKQPISRPQPPNIPGPDIDVDGATDAVTDTIDNAVAGTDGND